MTMLRPPDEAPSFDRRFVEFIPSPTGWKIRCVGIAAGEFTASTFDQRMQPVYDDREDEPRDIWTPQHDVLFAVWEAYGTKVAVRVLDETGSPALWAKPFLVGVEVDSTEGVIWGRFS